MTTRTLRQFLAGEAPDPGPVDLGSPAAVRADTPPTFDEPEPAPELATPAVPRLRPVKVEHVRPATAASWSVRRLTVPSPEQPTAIAGRHLGRTSLLVRNLSTSVTVDVGPNDSIRPGMGWPLSPGATLTLDATDAVWAVTASGSIAELVILAEFHVNTGGS